MIKRNNSGLHPLYTTTTGGRQNFPGLLSSSMTDQVRNTNGLETTQQRLVDRILMTWTTRQESVLPQTESQNKHRWQWRSLCTQVVLMDLPCHCWPTITFVIFCISEEIITFPAFLWSWALSGCGWMYEWWTVLSLDHKFTYCAALLSYCTCFIQIPPRTEGSIHWINANIITHQQLG